MHSPIRAADVPPRLVTGAFILHSGLQIWRADEDAAAGLHSLAVRAYPFLDAVEEQRFARLLAAGEIAVGSVLLAPFVPTWLAGLCLSTFAASLLGLYARTPGMHHPGSIWPTEQGIAVAKDSWMLGIGLGFAVQGTVDRYRRARS